jgi:hypothetical protein
MGSRANYVVVDDEGWRLFYSQWGGQLVERHIAAGPAYALRFIEEQRPGDPHTDWLDDVWCEGGIMVDTVTRRLLFFGGYGPMHMLGYRRALFSLLAQTWPGWTVGWAYNEIADIASYVGVDASVVLVSDPPAVTADQELVQRPSVSEFDNGTWALLTVRNKADHVRAWPVKATPTRHLAWAGEPLLTVLPGTWQARRSIEGLPPMYGLHLDLPARRMGWWSTVATLSFDQVPLRWPGWEVEFWQDHYEEQVVACSGSVRLPAIDLDDGVADLEGHLADDLDHPVDRVLRVFQQLRAEGRSIELTPHATAHTEVPADLSELRILADGLAAVRAQSAKP